MPALSVYANQGGQTGPRGGTRSGTREPVGLHPLIGSRIAAPAAAAGAAPTLVTLVGALDAKDVGHSQRVRGAAVELTRRIAPELLEDPSVELGFLVHDIGKLGIPDRVLHKPGPLTEAETILMQAHTVLGEELLAELGLLRGAGLAIVRSHHERWDGGGYPDGLGGADIPRAARIFAVADAFDAMTSDRPYRAALSWAEAAAELARERARQFDPVVVDAFLEPLKR